MTVRLSGVTWDHPRALLPLQRTTAAFAAETAIEIDWTARSLTDFGTQPIGELAGAHDLVVIDHPHVGEAAAAGHLLALDELVPVGDLATLASQSVGASHASYQYEGRQWALAVDAAAQVSAWRPDRLERPPATWAEAIALAEDGKVLIAAGPTDAFASFLTLAASRGTPCATASDGLIERSQGRAVLLDLGALVDRVGPLCLELDPIAVLERMSEPDAGQVYCPLVFGYSNYARTGSRPRRLRFGACAAGVRAGGALLGGAGLAVSAATSSPHEAAAFAVFACGAAAQRGVYVQAGGQPGNLAAWEDPVADELVGGFFSGTIGTMRRAWVRPRHPGWLAVQAVGMRAVHAYLSGRQDADETLDELDAAWRSNAPEPRQPVAS